jgi:hypothetical protein
MLILFYEWKTSWNVKTDKKITWILLLCSIYYIMHFIKIGSAYEH